MTPPRIYTCAEWGARAVATRFARKAAKGTVIHHTASPSRAPLTGEDEKARAFSLARGIQRLHMSGNGWSDTGQHFLVSRGGVICEGRHGSLTAAKLGLVVRGAHAGSEKANTTMFGVEVEGRYDAAGGPTEPQWAALVELCSWLAFWGKFQSAEIHGHREFTATACPGKLMDKLPELRLAVHDRKLEIMGGA